MKKRYFPIILLFALLFSACEPITPIPESLSATIMEIEGSEVFSRRTQTEDFHSAELAEILEVNSQVKTGEESRSRVDLSSGTVIRISPDSLFTLESNYEQDGNLLTRLKVEVGSIWIILNGGSLEVETPSGLAGVRGSYMSTGYDPASGAARITCLEGHCSAKNEAGAVEFTAGEAADLPADGSAPVKGLMTAEEFAQWAENVPEAASILPTPTPTALPTATPTVTPTATPQHQTCTVTSEFLYIRACPASTCEALGYVERDDRLPLVSTADKDGWLSVIFEEQEGWINAAYCE